MRKITLFFAGLVVAIATQAEVTVSGVEDMFQPVKITVPDMPLTPESFKGITINGADIYFNFKAAADAPSKVYIEVSFCGAVDPGPTFAAARPGIGTASGEDNNRCPLVALSPENPFFRASDLLTTNTADLSAAKARRANVAASSGECVVWRSEKVSISGDNIEQDISIGPWDFTTAQNPPAGLSGLTVNVDVLDEEGNVLGSLEVSGFNGFAPRLAYFDYANNKFYTIFPYDIADAGLYYIEEDLELMKIVIDWGGGCRDTAAGAFCMGVSMKGATVPFGTPLDYPVEKSILLSDESKKYNPTDNNFTQYSLHRGGLKAGAHSLVILWRSNNRYAPSQYANDSFGFWIPFIFEEDIPEYLMEEVDGEMVPVMEEVDGVMVPVLLDRPVPLYAYEPTNGPITKIPDAKADNNDKDLVLLGTYGLDGKKLDEKVKNIMKIQVWGTTERKPVKSKKILEY